MKRIDLKTLYNLYLYFFCICFVFSCMPTSNESSKDIDHIQPVEMTENTPIVEAQMLIRKPAAEVYNAFIDPSVTSRFWFSKSTGILEEGKTVTWEWEMYGVSTDVHIVQLIQNEKIIYTWGPPKATVELEFKAISNSTTYVMVKNYGFQQNGDELMAAVKDGTGGFTIVLAGLKAYLEHGIELNLIGDKYPKEVADYFNK